MICRITFSACNLLTKAESPVRLPVASRIRPNFLTSNSRYLSKKFSF
ncbi:hypothetical protein [Leptospira noguchii]|nr:hypothetical protein [Leptospira noguchii]UOG31066.1 hypothetical protein MAL06_03095 [Leptospira noguchii]